MNGNCLPNAIFRVAFTLVLLLGCVSLQARKEKVTRLSDGAVSFEVDGRLPAPKERFEFIGKEGLAQTILQEHGISPRVQHVIATGFPSGDMFFPGPDVFFRCVVQAYADHRPLVLSPDMVWLLVSQGFAAYVNRHAEEMRPMLVNHEGQTELKVVTKTDLLSPEADWERLMSDFAREIGQRTKQNLARTITADFSTTTPVERIASQITLMESVKKYFKFVAGQMACGIPTITLRGTPDDWTRLIDKVKSLNQYGMGEWTARMIPLLDEFVMAAKGEPNQAFWQDMVKKQRVKRLHKPRPCSLEMPTQLDGWFLTFFLDEEGRPFETVGYTRAMDDEMVYVGFKYQVENNAGEVLNETSMELWAGFVGIKEDARTKALEPQIGWMVRAGSEQEQIVDRLRTLDLSEGLHFIAMDSVPDNLRYLKHIRILDLSFKGEVLLPEWMNDIEIEDMTIRAKALTDEEKEQIKGRFPNTKLHFSNTPTQRKEK